MPAITSWGRRDDSTSHRARTTRGACDIRGGFVFGGGEEYRTFMIRSRRSGFGRRPSSNQPSFSSSQSMLLERVPERRLLAASASPPLPKFNTAYHMNISSCAHLRNLMSLFFARFSGLCSRPRFISLSKGSMYPVPCCCRYKDRSSLRPFWVWISVILAIRVSVIFT